MLSKTLAFILVFLATSTYAASKSSSMQPSIEKRYEALETFAKSLYFVETMYVDHKKVESEQLIQGAMKGMISHLDPHTMVMPKRAFEQLTVDTQGKFGGVGVIVSQERGKLIIISPIEDTPAAKGGIKSGDEIVEIDGHDLSKMKNKDAVDLMRGVPGSTLELVIKRKKEKKLIEFSLKREIIKVKSVREQRLGEKDKSIRYVRISSFQETTSQELETILKKHSKSIKGLILDLRDNPGGLLDQAVSVSDLFIESGLIVSTVGRDRNKIEREFAHKRGTFKSFPIVILVNDGSASASEIVAGALQDHQRALIMGIKTFGKGSVQTLLTLPDGSGLKLTVARYYTPKDRSIQAKGIIPDIVVGRKKPSNKKPKNGKRSGIQSESDLKGHIESSDLSDLARSKGSLQSLEDWPSPLQKDHQLVTAFTYLKGWSIFQK